VCVRLCVICVCVCVIYVLDALGLWGRTVRHGAGVAGQAGVAADGGLAAHTDLDNAAELELRVRWRH
jgi:hypothetical protein